MTFMRTLPLMRWICCAALLLPACVPYKPTLFLDPSPVTIPATVQVHTLRDSSPQDDKVHASAHSFSQTSADSLEEDLSALVTRAIVADFNTTSVFRSVASTERAPDLILSGTIHRFYGEVTLPAWAMIPGVAWAVSVFWSPVQERHGSVDLELTLSRPDGEMLGRYRSCEEYGEVAGHDHHYWSMPVYPAHRRLNQLFTVAVQQIRDQMLNDREYLVKALRDPADGFRRRDVSEDPPCPVNEHAVEAVDPPVPSTNSRSRRFSPQ